MLDEVFLTLQEVKAKINEVHRATHEKSDRSTSGVAKLRQIE